MMVRYSLKKALSNKLTSSKQGLLEEGFWTDLAVTLASGGPAALQQMAQNKLQSFLSKLGPGGEMETGQTLDMIGRFRKMGLKSMWGQDLEKLEKQLTRRQTKGKNKIDTTKLMQALGLEPMSENLNPFEKVRSLTSVFLDD